jgi:hypothetical protein
MRHRFFVIDNKQRVPSIADSNDVCKAAPYVNSLRNKHPTRIRHEASDGLSCLEASLWTLHRTTRYSGMTSIGAIGRRRTGGGGREGGRAAGGGMQQSAVSDRRSRNLRANGRKLAREMQERNYAE